MIPRKLTGTVEVDETYLGGKTRGKGRGPWAGGNKTMVVGAVERGGKLRLRSFPEPQGDQRYVLRRFVRDVVADDAESIYTDEHPALRGHVGSGLTRPSPRIVASAPSEGRVISCLATTSWSR